MENSTLMSTIYDFLKMGKYEDAINTIRGKECVQYLENNSMEAVPILSLILQEKFCNAETEECLEEILKYIASIANPKEALLVLLEEIESFRSTSHFRVVLQPLQTLLLKNVSPMANSNYFSWVFHSINTCISKLPLPIDRNFEEKEKMLLDFDPDVIEVTDTLSYALKFYEPFYEKILSNELAWSGINRDNGEYFTFFLLHLFHKPFAYLNISESVETDNPSILFCLCSKYVDMICNLFRNPFKFLYFVKPKNSKVAKRSIKAHNLDNDSKVEEAEPVSQLALAVFFYCVQAEGMSSSILPCVYANEYVFNCCLPSCLYLLEEKCTFAIRKGLVLFYSLLNKLSSESLPANSLEVPNCLDILHSLVQVMTFCDSKECRTLAFNSLKQWLWRFQIHERLQLITIILSTVTHPGLLGGIIHEVKEYFRKGLLSPSQSNKGFRGFKLQNILILCCKLPDGERTDILEWSDKIMGALNLLIFICLRDPENFSDYKSVLPKISEEFLKPLENGLRISKAHYELKMKDLQEGEKNSILPEVSTRANGETFQCIPHEQEKEMILQAISWFDIIQCVWARTNKIVTENMSLHLVNKVIIVKEL